jgi:hypothetical protein
MYMKGGVCMEPSHPLTVITQLVIAMNAQELGKV